MSKNQISATVSHGCESATVSHEDGYAPVRLHSIEEGRDWTTEIHRDLLSWLESNVRNPHVRNEIVLAYQQFLKHGEFRIHTGRFQYCHGGQASKALRRAIDDCPFLELAAAEQKRVSSRVYRFRLRGLVPSSADPTQSTEGVLSLSILSALSGYSKQVVLCGSWLRARCQRWARWCGVRGLELRLDLFGLTKLGRATFQALQKVSVPANNSFLVEIDDARKNGSRMSRRQFASWFHGGLINGRFLQGFMCKDGRSYCPLTNCPKSLRRLLKINGERLCEVDLGSSYFYLLASQLKDSPERQQLIRSIQDGTLYGQLFEFAGVVPDKVEIQRQILFSRDLSRKSDLPIWDAVRALFPQLARAIEWYRTQLGTSRFAKHLMRLEGQIMDFAHHKLIAQGIDAIRLHDALLVGESHQAAAAEAIISAGQQVFGIKPRVSMK